MKKHRRSSQIFALLIMIIIIALAASPIFAAPRVVYRVVISPHTSLYNILDSATVRGYISQYFDALSSYMPTGECEFTYSFAEYAEAEAMLYNGSADIICFPKAGGSLIATEQPVALLRYALCAASDKGYYYNDFASFMGMRVAFDSDFVQQSFSRFAANAGFSYTPVRYATVRQTKAALESGAADAMLIENHLCDENHTILSCGEAIGMYIMAAPQNAYLINSLNSARAAIDVQNPEFLANLTSRSFVSDGIATALSRAEADFIATKGIIRVACAKGNNPMSYFDGGTCKGVLVDLMRLIEKSTSLKFTFVPAEDTEDALLMLQNNKADLILGIYQSRSLEQSQSLALTEPLFKTSLTLAGDTRRSIITGDAHTVAIGQNQLPLATLLGERYPSWTLRYYASTAECKKALKSFEVDLCVWDSAVTSAAIAPDSSAHIGTILTDNSDIGVSLAARASEDELLLSVLNKAIGAISHSEYLSCVNRNSVSAVPILQFYHEHQSTIRVLLLIVLLLAAVVVLLIMYRLYMRAYRDSLTHLMNRAYLMRQGVRFQKKTNSALVVLDIVQFKRINSGYGVDVGDRVLGFVAKAVSHIGDKHSIAVHITADKFAVLTQYSAPDALMDSIRAALATITTYTEGSITTHLRFNIGICVLDRETPFAQIVNMADEARKLSSSSDNGIGVYSREMSERSKREKEIEDHAQSALDNGEFQVFYQPKYDPKSGKIVGAEALCRWISPTLGKLSPAEFIPLFERNGFVTKLDFYMLSNVCRLMRQMLDVGINPLLISVNQSRLHLADPLYIAKLTDAVGAYSIEPERLELEITEYTFEDGKAIAQLLAKIRKMGFKLSIDDFGSGYSSLNMLRAIPIDYIKLDKDFLRESRTSERTKIIIGQMIQMAKSLNIGTVCEGVETREQVALLTDMGCDAIQGFYYAKPMSEKDFIKTYFPQMQR